MWWYTCLQPTNFFNDFLLRLDEFGKENFTPTLNTWSLVERAKVISLYEDFFFLGGDGYPMLNISSLQRLLSASTGPSMSAQAMGKRPREKEVLVPSSRDLRSAKPEAAAELDAAAKKADAAAAKELAADAAAAAAKKTAADTAVAKR